jgi:hypothetical protein
LSVLMFNSSYSAGGTSTEFFVYAPFVVEANPVRHIVLGVLVAGEAPSVDEFAIPIVAREQRLRWG